MRIFVYPYKPGRRVPRLLRQLKKWRTIKLVDSKYRPKKNDVIINWGSSKIPNWRYDPNICILNRPQYVKGAVDKKECLIILVSSGCKTVEFGNRVDAENWINQGNTVYCRTTLQGHSGQGIVIAKTKEELVDAPLYTRGIGKCREYRIHVGNGKAFLISQKKRRNGNYDEGAVKNRDSGWIYSTQDLTPLPEGVVEDCVKACEVLGLEFCAVDVAVRKGEHFILEVNTAPGLHGVTVDAYIEMFMELIRSIAQRGA